jgi:hypothetical protein
MTGLSANHVASSLRSVTLVILMYLSAIAPIVVRVPNVYKHWEYHALEYLQVPDAQH